MYTITREDVANLRKKLLLVYNNWSLEIKQKPAYMSKLSICFLSWAALLLAM